MLDPNEAWCWRTAGAGSESGGTKRIVKKNLEAVGGKWERFLPLPFWFVCYKLIAGLLDYLPTRFPPLALCLGFLERIDLLFIDWAMEYMSL